jgi:hypothetical protein
VTKTFRTLLAAGVLISATLLVTPAGADDTTPEATSSTSTATSTPDPSSSSAQESSSSPSELSTAASSEPDSSAESTSSEPTSTSSTSSTEVVTVSTSTPVPDSTSTDPATSSTTTKPACAPWGGYYELNGPTGTLRVVLDGAEPGTPLCAPQTLVLNGLDFTIPGQQWPQRAAASDSVLADVTGEYFLFVEPNCRQLDGPQFEAYPPGHILNSAADDEPWTEGLQGLTPPFWHDDYSQCGIVTTTETTSTTVTTTTEETTSTSTTTQTSTTTPPTDSTSETSSTSESTPTESSTTFTPTTPAVTLPLTTAGPALLVQTFAGPHPAADSAPLAYTGSSAPILPLSALAAAILLLGGFLIWAARRPKREH